MSVLPRPARPLGVVEECLRTADVCRMCVSCRMNERMRACSRAAMPRALLIVTHISAAANASASRSHAASQP